MPDTLADAGLTTGTRTGAMITSVPSNSGPIVGQRKPTSAVLNIAYAMQYRLEDEDKSGFKKPAKIGVGVGAAACGLLIFAIVLFLVRKYVVKRRRKGVGYGGGVGGEDMGQLSHAPAGVAVARTHDGMKYGRVSTNAM